MTSLSLPSIFFLHHENGQGKLRAISTYCCHLVASRNPSSQLFMRTCHFAGINFLDFLFGDQIVSLLLLRVDRNQVSPSTQETSLNSSSGVVLLLIRPSDVRHASCCMIICALPAKQWGGHLCFALEIIETPMESFRCHRLVASRQPDDTAASRSWSQIPWKELRSARDIQCAVEARASPLVLSYSIVFFVGTNLQCNTSFHPFGNPLQR